MSVRTAHTAWTGGLPDGSGTVELVSSKSGSFDVSWPKRTAETGEAGTSPEELIAAAHSSCYAMQLSALIARAGGTPKSLDVTADVSFGPDPAGGFHIPGITDHRPRRRRRAGRRGLQGGRRGRQGLLPREQGVDRYGDHAGRRTRLTSTR